MVRVDTRKLQEIIATLPKQLEAALGKAAEEIVTDIKTDMLASPATGREYKRGGRVHVASSEGNAPRPDYGALIGSIRQESAGRLKRRITDGVEYGYMLETVRGRPWMRPVLERWRNGKLAQVIVEEVNIA